MSLPLRKICALAAVMAVWVVSTCRRPDTSKIVWQQRVPATYYGSPVCAGETIYCVSKAGDVIAIAASDKYQFLGKTPLGELCHSTPAIAGGKMFIRTYTHLYCISAVPG